MTMHIYVKELHSRKKKFVNYFSYLTLFIGAMLLFWSIYPIFSFELYSRLFIQNSISTPIPKTESVSSLDKAGSVLAGSAVYSNNLREFTKATLWFPSVKQDVAQIQKLEVKEYYVSIPKINLQHLKVIVGGEDLAKSLIHYLPKTMPGEYGNVAIFGHSTLPQLYNAKDYKTIFTYLPSLEKGDKIQVEIHDVMYTYEVFDMFVINPDQISVLEQKKDASYLTLITCVPPGTYWKRLVVKAKLTQLPDF